MIIKYLAWKYFLKDQEVCSFAGASLVKYDWEEILNISKKSNCSDLTPCDKLQLGRYADSRVGREHLKVQSIKNTTNATKRIVYSSPRMNNMRQLERVFAYS